RRFVAHQPVEHAAGLLSVDFLLVDVLGVGERVGDGVLGDLVEQYAAHFACGAAVPQLAGDVPGDRLTFPVGVGGDQHLGGGLGRFLDLGEGLRLFLDG